MFSSQMNSMFKR